MNCIYSALVSYFTVWLGLDKRLYFAVSVYIKAFSFFFLHDLFFIPCSSFFYLAPFCWFCFLKESLYICFSPLTIYIVRGDVTFNLLYSFLTFNIRCPYPQVCVTLFDFWWTRSYAARSHSLMSAFALIRKCAQTVMSAHEVWKKPSATSPLSDQNINPFSSTRILHPPTPPTTTTTASSLWGSQAWVHSKEMRTFADLKIANLSLDMQQAKINR